MSTVRCPHCGTANRAGSNFCNNCGVDLRADNEAPMPPVDPLQPAQTANRSEANHQPGREPPSDQPWLRPEEDEAAEAGELLDQEAAPPATRRLVANVQGLLDPVRVFSQAADELALAPPPQPTAQPVDLKVEQVRWLRSLMAEDPVLLDLPLPTLAPRLPALRITWVFLVLGLLLGLPLLLLSPPAPGEVRFWPGVDEAYAAVEDLPPGATVLLLWAYDPATAGELDLLALPLVVHLLERQLQPVVVSLLPNGPATARRLLARANEMVAPVGVAGVDQPSVPAGFLPGGVMALPLLGQNLGVGLNAQPGVVAPALMAAVEQPPALAIILAAQAEEVQQWLEQVQPLNGVRSLAFVSAGADPILRPYLESGQLQGLVSGFDGARAYQQRLEPLLASEGGVFQQQLFLQNWGHFAFLLLIVLGNLAALFGGRG